MLPWCIPGISPEAASYLYQIFFPQTTESPVEYPDSWRILEINMLLY